MLANVEKKFEMTQMASSGALGKLTNENILKLEIS
jgi:hypothetical protein